MAGLTDKEIQFVQYYLSAGSQWSQAVDMYRLAFGEEKEHVKDSSVQTYCKRILATEEAKKIISEHDSSNIIVTKTLMNRLKDVTNKIENGKLSHKERSDYIQHERIIAKQLNDSIRKKIEINRDSGEVGSGFTFNVIVPDKCEHCGETMSKVGYDGTESDLDPFEA